MRCRETLRLHAQEQGGYRRLRRAFLLKSPADFLCGARGAGRFGAATASLARERSTAEAVSSYADAREGSRPGGHRDHPSTTRTTGAELSCSASSTASFLDKVFRRKPGLAAPLAKRRCPRTLRARPDPGHRPSADSRRRTLRDAQTERSERRRSACRSPSASRPLSPAAGCADPSSSAADLRADTPSFRTYGRHLNLSGTVIFGGVSGCPDPDMARGADIAKCATGASSGHLRGGAAAPSPEPASRC